MKFIRLLCAVLFLLALPAPVLASERRYVPFLDRFVPVSVLEAPVRITDNAFHDFGATAARQTFGVKGQGIEVCVIDTGVDPRHEQLDGGKVVAFADFVGDQHGQRHTEAYDDHGHGTHVSSIVAGDGVPVAGGNNRLAFRNRGVAPLAAISAAKVLTYGGYGTIEGVINGIEWCVARGADVINMSLSTPSPYAALDEATNLAVNMGAVVVVAAGNAGPESSMGSPAFASQAVTVGAASDWSASPRSQSGRFSRGPYLAPFSSRGFPVASNIKPDVVGPGVTVTAAAVANYETANGYAALSGTSMASPYVAGTAALMLSSVPTLTPQEVKDALTATALDLGPPGKDIDYGAGYVNSLSAVARVANGYERDIFPHHETVQGSVDPASGHAYYRWMAVTKGGSIGVTAIFEPNVLGQPPHYGLVVYGIGGSGTVDFSACPNVRPMNVGWCGRGASGRTQIVSGHTLWNSMEGVQDAPGNHIIVVFPDTITSPPETVAATFTLDIFFPEGWTKE